MLTLHDMYVFVAGYALVMYAKSSYIPYFMNKKAMAEAISWANDLNRQGLIPEMYFRIKDKLL